MTNENLVNDSLLISCEELLELKNENPLQVALILDMLAEAGEDFYAEMEALEHSRQAA
jgi:hypothetical protein